MSAFEHLCPKTGFNPERLKKSFASPNLLTWRLCMPESFGDTELLALVRDFRVEQRCFSLHYSGAQTERSSVPKILLTYLWRHHPYIPEISIKMAEHLAVASIDTYEKHLLYEVSFRITGIRNAISSFELLDNLRFFYFEKYPFLPSEEDEATT